MKRLLSGITPSGDGSLHIGNYLGAVRQFIELVKTTECFLMVADLHALTTIQNKEQLKKNTEALILNELALLKGFLTDEEFNRLVFFRQSDVPMHTELQSILNNVTPLGLIKRAHAYKDKLARDVMEDEVNLGLFNYPILMAADILLYKPELVPVGKDQKQHIEITRDIAQRFNKTFKKNIFVLPEPHIPEDVAVILGTDGKRKMSKTLGNLISIFEDEAVIKKQVMSTYTDPTRTHANTPGHVEGNMVFNYLEFFGERIVVDEFKEAYRTGRVADIEVKEYLFQSLLQTFKNAREKYQELSTTPKTVKKILETGAQKAREVSSETMKEVREAIGLTNKYSFFEYANFIRPPLALRQAQGELQGVALQNTITLDEFAKVEERVGKVIEAKNVEGSDKLIRLVVDFGPAFAKATGEARRIIFTGVRPFGYTPEDFFGKQFFFVTNLKPRKMPSYVPAFVQISGTSAGKEPSGGRVAEESQGMILAVDGPEKPLFVSAEGMPLGVKIR